MVWPATPAFSTPYGNQGYSLNYSTTMLTTAQGATGQTITADVTYTLTFHAGKVAGTTTDYLAHLVAFDVADDNAARQNPNSMAGTIVAQATGTITASDMSDFVTMVFTPDASHPHLGKELGIRFDKASGNAIYDNVRLILGHDYAPNPANGEDLSAGGNVTLSWTNLPPQVPATETYVDLLFGSDPENLSLILEGQLGSSVVASAPQAGTYYWQIVSYPDGNPEGTPVASDVFSFTIADTDGDGLLDSWETNTGVTNKPVKVYIMSGQSNMLGFGKVSGPEDSTLDNITGKFNRFPNLRGPGGEYLARPDVKYRGVYSGIANMPLAPGGGKDSNSIGPELGFGQVMGWHHDEPVLLLKSSIGNRSLGWDVLPPGSPSYEYGGLQYAAYGERSQTYPIGESSAPWTPGDWYAGKEFDGYFTDESEWAHPGDPVTNVVDVLDNFATQYPEWADQGFEIAGFVWWQGDKDRYNMGHATRYEQNLVSLINTLRSYYSNRYAGKVVPNAPFVLATLGQTPLDATNEAEKAILDAQLAVDGDSGKYPEFAGNVNTVYAHPLSQGGASNSHYGLNSETYLLVGDALGVAMLELQDDTSAPSPNPLTFAIEPSAVDATTVGMVATTATDTSTPVEYFFENLTNGNTSGWITGTRWDNTGLAAGSYDYRVKARDALGNEGDWSATVSASPGSDVTAPTPDPMSFEVLPSALGENSITMSATPAGDINGVEYFFEAVSGGTDSGWQTSPSFTDTGLQPETEYIYQVKARDTAENLNETAFSAPASATTSPAPSGPGGALIYEPFAQDTGSLAGKGGGTGLNGNWAINQTFTVVAPPTLPFGDLPSGGGQVEVPNNNGAWAAITTTSALADAGLLADGATLWFSYVFQNSSGGGSNEHSGFAFATERVSPAYNGLNLASAGSGFGVYVRNSSATASSWSNSTSRSGGTGVSLQA